MKIMQKIDKTAENEFNNLLRISHENILRYFDHFDCCISGMDHTCVITEFCEVILEKLMKIIELIK